MPRISERCVLIRVEFVLAVLAVTTFLIFFLLLRPYLKGIPMQPVLQTLEEQYPNLMGPGKMDGMMASGTVTVAKLANEPGGERCYPKPGTGLFFGDYFLPEIGVESPGLRALGKRIESLFPPILKPDVIMLKTGVVGRTKPEEEE